MQAYLENKFFHVLSVLPSLNASLLYFWETELDFRVIIRPTEIKQKHSLHEKHFGEIKIKRGK